MKFPAGVEDLLKNTFRCLGMPGIYRNSTGEFPVRVLGRERESFADVGEGSFLSSRITFELHVADVPVVCIGDTITLNDRVYKVFQAPLKDPTGTTWTVEGMVLTTPQNLQFRGGHEVL
jgi:hypothetical protein